MAPKDRNCFRQDSGRDACQADGGSTSRGCCSELHEGDLPSCLSGEAVPSGRYYSIEIRSKSQLWRPSHVALPRSHAANRHLSVENHPRRVICREVRNAWCGRRPHTGKGPTGGNSGFPQGNSKRATPPETALGGSGILRGEERGQYRPGKPHSAGAKSAPQARPDTLGNPHSTRCPDGTGDACFSRALAAVTRYEHN